VIASAAIGTPVAKGALPRKIQELAQSYRASIVLIEDKASGTALIQELRAASVTNVQAAPALAGDKVVRLRVGLLGQKASGVD
jgi:phage terminase large subunit-like protein